MGRLLDTIDEWVAENVSNSIEPARRYEPTSVDESPPLITDLKKSGIKTIMWATGFHPDYSWIDLPIFDRKGKVRHDGGIVDFPGIYLLGTTFLRRRKSSFIHGAEDDARDLCADLVRYLDRISAQAS